MHSKTFTTKTKKKEKEQQRKKKEKKNSMAKHRIGGILGKYANIIFQSALSLNGAGVSIFYVFLLDVL